MSQLILNFFGSPDIRYGQQTLTFPTRKALALLVYLATESGTPSRDALATLLWPESDAARGRTALRKTLALLKSTLDRDSPTRDLLLVTRQYIGFNLSVAVDCDLHLISAAFRSVSTADTPDRSPESALDEATLLRAAVERYRGDFLAGFSLDDALDFDNWASLQRETWHHRMSILFERLLQIQSERGDYMQAIGTAARWIAHDTLNEAAHRQLIALNLVVGDRAAALRAYQACQEVLQAELGVEPDPETHTLAERIFAPPPAARPLVPHRQPADSAHTAARPSHNLPRATASLIGRSAELAAIREQLLQQGVRLLTLVGSPGIGKTTLAIAEAHQLVPHFADGVWFIDLVPLREPEQLPAAIAHILDIHETDSVPLFERLVESLRNAHMLLVLDNCEHMLAAAPFMSELLDRCPRVAILATSREHLRLSLEQRFPVAPLALPSLTEALAAEEIAQSAAVCLFVQQSRKARPDFAITEKNVQLVAQLCVRLDGLPLALELAAGQITLLSPAAMLARLESRLPLPAAGARDAPTRHQTLYAAVSFSYELLDPLQQALLRRLAVFVGGWTPDAAQAVAAIEPPESDMLYLIAALVDHNLIQRIDEGDTGESRFDMLETIRDYALQQLRATGELATTQQRHAYYFADYVERARTKLRGAEQRIWLARLECEHDNCRAALRWALAAAESACALRLCASLCRFWELRGNISEGLYWLEQVLDLPVDLPETQALALGGAGNLLLRRGDFTGAGERYSQALAIRTQLNDRKGIAVTLNNLGLVASSQGEHDRATRLYNESLTLKREFQDSAGIAATLNNLGLVAMDQHEYQRAQALHEEALTVRRQFGDEWGIAGSLTNLGKVAVAQGQRDQAFAFFRESLTITVNLGHNAGIADNLEGLAVALSEQQDWQQATRLWGAAAHLREVCHTPLWPDEQAEQERLMAIARTQLGSDTFDQVWAEGRGSPLDVVIEHT